MKKIIENSFGDYIDTIQMINHAARNGLGEDSFFCAQSDDSAIVAVFDGCGGLGARKYEAFQGHTGAYMASRTVAGAICDWYNDNRNIKWGYQEKSLEGLKHYIMRGYKVICFRTLKDKRNNGSKISDNHGFGIHRKVREWNCSACSMGWGFEDILIGQ